MMRSFCVLPAIALCSVFAIGAENVTVSVHQVVMMPKMPEASPQAKQLEECGAKIAKLLDLPGGVTKAECNPECCIWIEMWSYEPKGFIVRIQPSGMTITAGSIEAMNEAIEFIKRNVKKAADGWQLPRGNFSNLKIAMVKPNEPEKK